MALSCSHEVMEVVVKRTKEGASVQTCLFSHLLTAQSGFDLWIISVRKLQKWSDAAPILIYKGVCVCVCVMLMLMLPEDLIRLCVKRSDVFEYYCSSAYLVQAKEQT